jgi:hypothetical protein
MLRIRSLCSPIKRFRRATGLTSSKSHGAVEYAPVGNGSHRKISTLIRGFKVLMSSEHVPSQYPAL